MTEHYFFSVLPVRSRPIAIAFVGPNGSGKSSVTNLLSITNVRAGDQRYRGSIVVDETTGETLLPLVNPDEVAKAIHGQNPNLDWDSCNIQAAETASRMRERLSDASLDFGFETVGSHPSKLAYLQKLKERGYTVAIVFVTTEDPEINVRRVASRCRNGGHDVPDHKVRSRYERTMGLFPQYLEVADYMAVYDNSVEHTVADEAGPKLLLVKKDGETSITEDGHASSWLSAALGDANKTVQ